MNLILVFTTTASLDLARRIARTLVERHLVACAHISEIKSYYTWDGAVQNDSEFSLMLKTTEPQYQAVETAIRALHTYELPAIHAVPVSQASLPYAQWVQSCCDASPPTPATCRDGT